MLTLTPRFGLTSTPTTLDDRELMLIQGALVQMKKYHELLARQAEKRPAADPETIGRNRVNALEVSVLMEKIDAILSPENRKEEGT